MVIIMVVVMPMMVVMIMVVLMPMMVVLIMVVLKHLLGFFLALYLHMDMSPANTTLFILTGRHFHTGNSDVIDLLKKCISVREQFQQCGCQHITCSSHITFNI